MVLVIVEAAKARCHVGGPPTPTWDLDVQKKCLGEVPVTSPLFPSSHRSVCLRTSKLNGLHISRQDAGDQSAGPENWQVDSMRLVQKSGGDRDSIQK